MKEVKGTFHSMNRQFTHATGPTRNRRQVGATGYTGPTGPAADNHMGFNKLRGPAGIHAELWFQWQSSITKRSFRTTE